MCGCPKGFRKAPHVDNLCLDIDECYEELATCFVPGKVNNFHRKLKKIYY